MQTRHNFMTSEVCELLDDPFHFVAFLLTTFVKFRHIRPTIVLAGPVLQEVSPISDHDIVHSACVACSDRSFVMLIATTIKSIIHDNQI
jgi:hypothetical protein